MLGGVVSVKFVGLFTVAAVGLYTIHALWALFSQSGWVRNGDPTLYVKTSRSVRIHT